jgi:hypothetical protein
MNEGLYIAFIMILIHWWADFVLQKDEWAKNKSKSWSALLKHTGSYSLVWLASSISLVWWYHLKGADELDLLWFAPITFIAHTITDAITSRINSKLYSQGKIHEFFVVVGFDQVLHYAQLFLTFILLTK